MVVEGPGSQKHTRRLDCSDAKGPQFHHKEKQPVRNQPAQVGVYTISIVSEPSPSHSHWQILNLALPQQKPLWRAEDEIMTAFSEVNLILGVMDLAGITGPGSDLHLPNVN